MNPYNDNTMKNYRCWLVSVVLRSVHAGGNLNNGANAGLAARNSNNSLTNSNTNNGSQLSYDTLSFRPTTLSLGKT